MEIKKDYCVEVVVYGRRLIVSPVVDVVHRFNDAEYNHLKYLDNEQHRFSCEFIGQAALSELVGLGIPETRTRLYMTESEHAEWIQWKAAESGLFVPEQPALPPADPIDTEVQRAHEHIDAELGYYLREWTE